MGVEHFIEPDDALSGVIKAKRPFQEGPKTSPRWQPALSEACFRWKFDDCLTGWFSDWDPACCRWSQRLENAGLLAEVTLSVSNDDSTKFRRPIHVQKYSSVLCKEVEAFQKNITTYEGLQKILDDTEDLAFCWKFQSGCSGWSKWTSQTTFVCDLAAKNPHCLHPISMKTFRGRPGQHTLETYSIDSAESLKSVLAKMPTLLRSRWLSTDVVAACLAHQIYNLPDTLEWACKAENESAFYGIKLANCSMMSEISKDRQSIFVIFRGTCDAMAIFTDLKCTLSTENPWHQFGLNVQQSMWEDLKEALKDGSAGPGLVSKLFNTWKENRSAELVIGGHSLGGGLAMILQAYTWIQANTRECDDDFKKAFDEAQEFKDFLRSSKCYAFGGPTVFAKVGEVPAALTTHLTSTVKNYMFQDDLVPRAYGALDVEALMKTLGQQLSQKYRAMSAIAELVPWAARSKSALEALEALKSSWDLRRFEKDARKYVHCCQVVVIGQRNIPWNRVRVSPQALSHHEIATYCASLEWPTAETFKQIELQWTKESEEAAKPGMSDSSIWSIAETSDWTNLLDALKNEDPDSSGLPDGEVNHFVDLAALQSERYKKPKVIELLRRGVDPLMRHGDGKSIAEVVMLKDSDPFKKWLADLVDVADELSRAGFEGSDIPAFIVNYWDENKQLPDVDGDTFCKLKRQNLKLQGVEDSQDESESYSDARASIEKKHGNGTLERQKLELDAGGFQHRIELDDALSGASRKLLTSMTTSSAGDTCEQTRFEGKTSPPAVPDSPWFFLANTTVYVVNSTAAHIGNTILDLFAAECVGAINKVNFSKFSIKAEVCVDSFQCGVKTRVYEYGTKHALEFQMRSGDALAFNSFYNQALEYLKSCKIEF